MLRTLGATLAAIALCLPAHGEEVADRVIDVEFRTLAIDLRTLDIVFAGSGVEGEVKPLAVEETPTEIRIALSADVLFDFDKSDIRDEAASALKQVAAMIREHPDRPVRIEGHTDSKGSDAYNQRLSEDRALSVKDWLVDEEGLDGVAFETTGFGEARPAAPNETPDGADDPDGRQKNRRVEIVIGK